MLNCLIYLIVYCIIAVLILYVIETILSAFKVGLPPPIMALLRLLVAILVLIAILECFGIVNFALPRTGR